MARALTVKTVEAAQPDPEKRLEIPDAGLSGLYLVVQPSGTKSWALRYRLAGKPAKLTLGRWPVMGLAAARAAAAEAVQRVEHGDDPALAKKRLRPRGWKPHSASATRSRRWSPNSSAGT